MATAVDSSKETEPITAIYSTPTVAFESMEDPPVDLLPEISESVCAFSKAYESFLQQSGGAFPCMKYDLAPSCYQSGLIESCLQPEEEEKQCEESEIPLFESKPQPNSDNEDKVEVNYDGESSMIVTTSSDGQLASVESVKKGWQGRTRSFVLASGTRRAFSRSSAGAKSNSPEKEKAKQEKKVARPRSAPRLFSRSRSSPPPSPVSPVEELRQTTAEKRVAKTKNVVRSRSTPKNIAPSTKNKQDNRKEQVKPSAAEAGVEAPTMKTPEPKQVVPSPSRAAKPVRYFREGEETLNDNGSSVHMIQLQRIEF